MKLCRFVDINVPRFLPIVCANGIGDSFLILSRIPIEILGRLGFRFRIYYIGGSPQNRAILAPFLSSIKYCEYTPNLPSQRESLIFSKILSLWTRWSKIFKPPFVCAESPVSDVFTSVGTNAHSKQILLHTHLDQNLT